MTEQSQTKKWWKERGGFWVFITLCVVFVLGVLGFLLYTIGQDNAASVQCATVHAVAVRSVTGELICVQGVEP